MHHYRMPKAISVAIVASSKNDSRCHATMA